MKVFKDLYNYRELLKTSVKKDIGGKYKNSFLGVLWSFINPLLQILVYALIFPLVMKNGGSYKDYTVFMVCGLIPWAYFTTVINRASFIMIENGNILKKVYFPRSILPLSLVTSETINFLVSCIIILAFIVIKGFGISYFIFSISAFNTICFTTWSCFDFLSSDSVYEGYSTFYRCCFTIIILCYTNCLFN